MVLSAAASDDNSSSSDKDDAESRSTSFAKADQSLIEEADQKRMDESGGDYDLNSDVRNLYCLALHSGVVWGDMIVS
jgi:hypothetical protein